MHTVLFQVFPVLSLFVFTCFVTFLVWCLLELSKKPFSFCLWGLAGICHSPWFCHCVLTKVVSCPIFFFVIAPFLSCVVLLLFALTCFIFCILFGLVFRVESLPTLVPQKALCPCSCGLRSVTVVPECLYPHWAAHTSEQGWKTASSTAPFLNANGWILDMWLFLCPLLQSSLLHSFNLVGSFLLWTFLPRLNSTVHGSSGITNRPVWACSLLVPCGSIHSVD